MPLAAGTKLSFYEILAPLGAGAMGEVYRAKDTRLGREVAIKVLPEHFADDAERLKRFEREAHTLASLNHPNVAQIRLESYEDALNNLEPQRTKDQQDTLFSKEADGADGFREDCLLRYMLDVETRGNPSLLNVRAFHDPMRYMLKVKRPGSDESREVAVDLLETFNWLLGLVVREINAPQSFSAEFERNKHERLEVKDRIKPDPTGPWWFRAVTGTLRSGERVVVIWRKRPGGETVEGMEQDNLVLDEWLRKVAYSTKDLDFDLIYVNGDNNLPNVRRNDETWKVRLIEEDFHRLMFEGTES